MAATTTQPLTAEDLLKMPDDGFQYELVRGELRRVVPPGAEHSGIAAILVEFLGPYVRKHHMGKMYVELGCQLAHDTVRAPDVAFIRRERVEAAGDVKGYWQGPPDLAVEVISPNDTYEDVEDKVWEWIDAGTQMVMVVNSRKRRVTIYRSRTDIRVLTENDMIEGGEVIPGWTLPVRDLFV